MPRIATVVTGVDADNIDGTYGVGQGLNITVAFSEAVSVSGMPQLCLETGAIDAFANYSYGNLTTTLGFYYQVQPGHNNLDLDYNWTNALCLNGGTIKNLTNDDVDLTLPAPGAAGSLSFARNIVINTGGTPPAAPVLYTILPDPDTDGDITLNWTAVTGAIEYHVYRYNAFINAINGSLTNVTSFPITYVTVNDTPSGLWSFAITAYNASGESGPSNCDDVTVTLTTAIIIKISSPVSNGTYGAGQMIGITVDFNETVYVTGMPQISLETGVVDGVANYSVGSGSSILTFNYMVLAGHNSLDLDYVSANALSLNGGTIQKTGGIDANLTMPAPGSSGSLGNNKNIVINTAGTPPAAPALDTIFPDLNTDGYVFLNWSAAPGATEYHVYRYNAPITAINGSLTNLTSTIDTDYNASTPAGLWYFAITAYNASGESGPSNCDDVTVNLAGTPPATPVLDMILPDPDTDGDITLNWTAVTGATEYHVYRYNAFINIINGSLINVTMVTLPNTTVYGVPGGLWYFAITAYNASGESGPSNCDDVTVNLVSNPPNAPFLDIILPNPDTDGNVTLYWNAVPGATEYHVYCYDSFIDTINGTLTNITAGSPDFLPNMTVLDLPSGLWYFVVSAFNASGESGPSNCQNVTVILDSFPQVNFTVNATYISAGMQVQFFNNTIEGNAPLSFLWNFGDGSANSTAVNPIHQYLTAGSYYPVLAVTDIDGDFNWTQLFIINVTGGLQNLPPGFDPVNDTMDYNVTEGFNQNIVLQTGYNVSISILLNTTSNVVVTIASWTENPTSSVPGFRNASAGIYFALEVNDTNLIVFPISITIPLPKDIPAGATVEEILKSIRIFTWNTTTGWIGENFEISVNLAAGTMTIRVTHLSIFAVGIQPVEDNSLWFWIGISLAIVGAAGAVLAIIKMRGRKKKKPQEEEVVLDFDWDDV